MFIYLNVMDLMFSLPEVFIAIQSIIIILPKLHSF